MKKVSRNTLIGILAPVLICVPGSCLTISGFFVWKNRKKLIQLAKKVDHESIRNKLRNTKNKFLLTFANFRKK